MIDINSNNKDEDFCEKFAYKVLLMIDNAFKDAFLTMPLMKYIEQSVRHSCHQCIGIIYQKRRVLDEHSKK